MRIENNTILITGGATGIGFALAEAFLNAGNEVIICGRREERLSEARQRLPSINALQCDVTLPDERERLYNEMQESFPHLNILVNNAGIQRMINFTEGPTELLSGESEVEVNLVAPIHLSAYFIPLLKEQDEAAIVNISSGLGFVPLAFMPVYCATKAALHSFCLSLRHQLRATQVKVFEVIPPTTDTELDKGARDQRGQRDRGIPPAEVATATLDALACDQYEVAVGFAENLRAGAREDPEELFHNMNRF